MECDLVVELVINAILRKLPYLLSFTGRRGAPLEVVGLRHCRLCAWWPLRLMNLVHFPICRGA